MYLHAKNMEFELAAKVRDEYLITERAINESVTRQTSILNPEVQVGGR